MYPLNKIKYRKLFFQYGGRFCDTCQKTMDDAECPECNRPTYDDRKQTLEEVLMGQRNVFNTLTGYLENDHVDFFGALPWATNSVKQYNSPVLYSNAETDRLLQYTDLTIYLQSDLEDFLKKVSDIHDFRNWNLRKLTILPDYWTLGTYTGQIKLPDCITHLIYAYGCDTLPTLPANLTYLRFVDGFSHRDMPFAPGFRFPHGLRYLEFDHDFDQRLPRLPDTLTHLILYPPYNNGDVPFPDDYKFPSALTNLTIPHTLKHRIPSLPHDVNITYIEGYPNEINHDAAYVLPSTHYVLNVILPPPPFPHYDTPKCRSIQ